MHAQTAASTNYLAGSGTEQNFTIAKANPTAPSITNLPAGGPMTAASSPP